MRGVHRINRQQARLARSQRITVLTSGLDPLPRPVILDIGANPLSPPPYHFLLTLGLCEVVGFEPQQAAYEALVAQPQENRRYVNAAVGTAGKAQLHVYPSSGFTSLYELSESSQRFLGSKAKNQIGKAREIEVDLKPIDKLAEIGSFDMLKMDVQGAERDILRGGKAKLKNALCVIPEMRYYPLYVGEPTLGDLDNELRAQGFQLHKFLPTRPRQIANSQSRHAKMATVATQMIDGDAVYIRTLEDPSDLSDRQIATLALLADGVIDSPDLCVFCLDLLVQRKSIAFDLPRRYADAL